MFNLFDPLWWYKGYNPDQARDENGRFAGDGASGSVSTQVVGGKERTTADSGDPKTPLSKDHFLQAISKAQFSDKADVTYADGTSVSGKVSAVFDEEGILEINKYGRNGEVEGDTFEITASDGVAKIILTEGARPHSGSGHTGHI